MDTTKIRRVAAARLREWMAGDSRLNTQVKVANAAGIAQASVQRLLSCKESSTVDKLAAIAGAFCRSAAELLEDPEEDGIRYDRTAFRRLKDSDKASIERFIAFTISGAVLHVDEDHPPTGSTEQNLRAAKRPITTSTLSSRHEEDREAPGEQQEQRRSTRTKTQRAG
jgi:transcriptional regulator with XRE-family HTH domain